MAIKYKYTIIPFSSIGLEDSLRIAFSIPLHPLLKIMGEVRPNLEFPVLLPYNNLEKMYITMGESISTVELEGDWEDEERCVELYKKVHAAVEKCMNRGLERQASDEERYFSTRLWRGLTATLGSVWSVVL